MGGLARGRRLERVATCPRFRKLESRLERVVDVQMLCGGRKRKGYASEDIFLSVWTQAATASGLVQAGQEPPRCESITAVRINRFRNTASGDISWSL